MQEVCDLKYTPSIPANRRVLTIDWLQMKSSISMFTDSYLYWLIHTLCGSLSAYGYHFFNHLLELTSYNILNLTSPTHTHTHHHYLLLLFLLHLQYFQYKYTQITWVIMDGAGAYNMLIYHQLNSYIWPGTHTPWCMQNIIVKLMDCAF